MRSAMLTLMISPGSPGSTIWRRCRRGAPRPASVVLAVRLRHARRAAAACRSPRPPPSAWRRAGCVGGNSASAAGVLNEEPTSQTAGPNMTHEPADQPDPGDDVGPVPAACRRGGGRGRRAARSFAARPSRSLRRREAELDQGQHHQHGAHQDRGGGGEAGVAQLRGEAGLVDVLGQEQRAVPGPPPVST